MPGIFEMVLIRPSLESLTDWHRRFVELFEALYETGYSRTIADPTTPLVRFLPVGKAIEAHPMALPADQLEVVLDQFEDFRRRAVPMPHRHGRRSAAAAASRKGNCAVMGRWAKQGRREGVFREVSKREMLDIKREAEAHGMVNWMMNVAATKGQCSCSCCGCCCHAMRAISEFNVPGLIAPPHFLPRFDAAKCVSCGKCAGRARSARSVVDVQAQDLRASPRALRRLRPVRGGLRAEEGHRHGAGARLPIAVSQLVLADCPRHAGHDSQFLQSLAAKAVGDHGRGLRRLSERTPQKGKWISDNLLRPLALGLKADQFFLRLTRSQRRRREIRQTTVAVGSGLNEILPLLNN